jgi:hypothetical protein
MQRDPADVSKQLGRYADGITVLAFTQTLVVLIALNSTKIAPVQFDPGVPLIIYAVYGGLVYACQRGEDVLWEKSPESRTVDRWANYIRYGRMAIILISATLFVLAGWLPIAFAKR